MGDARYLKVGMPLYANSSPAASSTSILASNSQEEWIFEVEEALTITKVGFRQGTNVGTAPAMIVSLQGVTAGAPDGTIKGGGSPCSHVFTATSGTNGAYTWYTLDNPYTAIQGELLALVVAYSSGTINSSNCLNITVTENGVLPSNFPYAINNVGGVRTNQVGQPMFGYASSAQAYGFPFKTITGQAISNATGVTEWAMNFTLPGSWGSSYQIIAVNFLTLPTSGHNLLVNLYNGGGAADKTVLQTKTFDTTLTSSAVTKHARVPFDTSPLAVLSFGSTYRLGLAPQDSTTQTFYTLDMTTASDFMAYPGGQDFMTSTRAGSGNWTDVATSRLFAELILSDITRGGMLNVPIIGKAGQPVF